MQPFQLIAYGESDSHLIIIGAGRHQGIVNIWQELIQNGFHTRFPIASGDADNGQRVVAS